MKVLEYTTALLELAIAQRISRQVSADLEVVLAWYERDIKIFSTQRSFTTENRSRPDLSKLVRQTISLIITNHDQASIPFICAHYWKLVSQKEFDILVNVTVTSAVELDACQREEIRRRLLARLKKDLAIEYVVDPSIIGGVVVQAGDLFMNYSVARELELLERSISQKAHYV